MTYFEGCKYIKYILFYDSGNKDFSWGGCAHLLSGLFNFWIAGPENKLYVSLLNLMGDNKLTIDEESLVEASSTANLDLNAADSVSNSSSTSASPAKTNPMGANTPKEIIGTPAYYNELIGKLINFEVTWEELERQGVKKNEIIELSNASKEDLVSMLKHRRIPYSPVSGYDAQNTVGEAEFFSILTGNYDVDLYMFAETGEYCGFIQFGADGNDILLEQIKGVGMETGGEKGFVMSGGIDVTTMFMKFKEPTLTLFHVQYDSDEMASFSFPVSSRTMGSVTITRDGKKFSVSSWNIDVDGDGKTDVSFGNDGPSDEIGEKMLRLIANDVNLSESEKTPFQQMLDSAE